MKMVDVYYIAGLKIVGNHRNRICARHMPVPPGFPQKVNTFACAYANASAATSSNVTDAQCSINTELLARSAVGSTWVVDPSGLNTVHLLINASATPAR